MLTSEQQAITRILTQATQYRASDVHLVPGNPPVLRIDGKLTPLNDSVILTAELLRSYVETTLTPAQLERLDKERDARIVVSLEGKMRFRLVAMYQKGTISLELRYIPDVIPTLKELNLPSVVDTFPTITQGLIIISGPFGSGRTTTLAGLISAINALRACHLVTIERPIEFLFAGEKSVIEQREVGTDVTSVSHGLEVLELEDVDVVVISELENQKDMQAAVRTTHAGRLVLATLAADSAVQSIELLTTAFPESEQPWARKKLSEVLQGVMNLRLVPRVGGGRILVSEVLAPSTAMRAVIRDGQFLQLANTMQTSREEGSVSLDRSLAELVRIGDVMPEDAEAVAFDSSNLKFMVSRG
jgi:twitching motility protein PilT